MNLLIKSLLHERLSSISTKKQYLGQCDTLRRKCDVNELYWAEMMKRKQPIDFKTLIRSVDMSAILDDGESPIDYINTAKATDSDTAAYRSIWGDSECMFFQTAGFEFIFV